MSTVLLFGTFDFLHSGHLHAFLGAKKHADKLVVCVARDSAVTEIKGTAPIHFEEERLALVQHIDIVDSACLGDTAQGVYSVIGEVNPDVIALGYDQHELKQSLTTFLAERGLSIPLVTLGAYGQGQMKSSTKKASLGL
jgi:FAD synthetase